MRETFQNFVVPCLMLLLCALFWRETNTIPPPNFDPLGASFFPRMNISIIALCSILLLASNIYNKHKGKASTEELPVSISAIEYMRMAITLGMLLIYVLAIMYTEIHFIWLTFSYLSVFGMFLTQWDLRKLPGIILSATIVSAVIYGIFGMFLEIFFP